VLNLAASKFGWDGRSKQPRVGSGVAIGTPFGTTICAMAEVAVTDQGEVRIRRAVVAVDCGVVVNPNTIEAQVEGGLLFGWTAALHGQVTFKDGTVEQSNFNNYRVLRLTDAVPTQVYTVPSSEAPTGIGEPPTCISGPCLANAIFGATGVRIRRLPIDRNALVSARSALTSVVS